MLQVVGAGFGRTGSASLTAALEELGFDPCLHMRKLLAAPGVAAMWRRASRGEAVDWAEILDGYRASVGWPGARFWRELLALFPEAKVVLTVRDPERWYDSVRNTFLNDDLTPYVEALEPRMAAWVGLVEELIFEGVFGGRLDDADHAIAVFEEHNAAVRREVPGDRLLEYDVAHGWDPLCAFLDVPVPGHGFPWRNDRRQFARFVQAGASGDVRRERA